MISIRLLTYLFHLYYLLLVNNHKNSIYLLLVLFRAEKCVIINEEDEVYYDYLFLLYGEQFGFSAKESETKSDTSIK